MRLRSETAPRSTGAAVTPVPVGSRSGIGGAVAASLVAGFVAAVVLPFLPVNTVDVNFSTAMALFGWALGWALLAVLSIRFTDQPQRWAVVPAIFMTVAGVLALVAPDPVVDALGWVWPPTLVILVVWVWIRAKRELHSVPAPPGGHRLTRSDGGSRARCRRLRRVHGVDRTSRGSRQPRVATSSRLGAARVLADTSFSDLPPQYRDDARATAASAKEMSGVLDEYGVANRSAPEAGRLRTLDAKPLIVLTAERGSSEGWMADQNKTVTLSTNSLHRVVPGSTHASFIENPDHAAAVTRAIHDMVVSARTGEPLKGP